jgi:hypothetical protein
MKPTAPPVKRGSPCTNGARNSAISFRRTGTKGSSDSVVTPERSMIVLPPRDRSTRKGSLPRNEYRATCSPPSTLSNRKA